MWLTDHLGKAIYRLVKNPPPDAAALAAPEFPRRLSESGLFRSVADHTMADGVLPYSVNAQLWSDGAYKERYLALPHRPDEDCRIGYTGSGGWNFPNGTVLIKSFALESASSTPARGAGSKRAFWSASKTSGPATATLGTTRAATRLSSTPEVPIASSTCPTRPPPTAGGCKPGTFPAGPNA